MVMRLSCRCGAKLSISKELLGKRVKCTQCGAVLQVPAQAPAGPAPAPAVPPAPAPGASSPGAPETSPGSDSSPAAPKTKPGTTGPRKGACTNHPEAPVYENCPQCQRPFCQACLVTVEQLGLLCPECHRMLVMAKAKVLKQQRQKKLLLAGLPVAAVLLVAGSVAMWKWTSLPTGTRRTGSPEISGLPAPGPIAPLPTESATTAPALEDDAPEALPPRLALEVVDPAPAEVPPRVTTPTDKAVARLTSEAGKVHEEVFQNLEDRVSDLKEKYQQSGSETRIETVRELIALNHRKALEPLQLALHDLDDRVRSTAAIQLGRFASARSVQPLNEALRKDSAEGTRAAAADALARCGDESAFPALLQALRDPSSQVRQKAYDALRRLSGQFFLFDPAKPPAEQAAAIQQWEQWFEENRNQVIRGDWYRMRTPIGQRIGMIRFGGAGTERAVGAALEWFVKAQYPDGYWTNVPYPETQPEWKGEKPVALNASTTVGLTGLAVLSFLASGHTPEVGAHREVVGRAVEWILKSQQADGRFLYQGSRFYGHGICTMAICEAYGMTGNERYKEVAVKALDFIVNTQGRIGGFTYTGPGFDTSVSGWMFMGLIAGLEAGLEVPEQALRKAQYYLRFMLRPNGSTAYNVSAKDGLVTLGGGSYATTAIGIICRQFFSYPPDDKEIQLSLEYLNKWKADPKAVYTLYYTTLVKFQMGGKDWVEWNNQFKDLVLQRQEASGVHKGSWPPEGVDYAGHGGGRTYATALSNLCLQAYYRYPPIYK